MTLQSMTGFSRVEGNREDVGWFIEVRSVNAKGLDLRVRLPQGYDALEPKLRALAAKYVTRGTLHVSLTVSRSSRSSEVRLNEPVLKQLLAAAERICELTGGQMPATAELMNQRGVIEVVESQPGEHETEALMEAILASFANALEDLVSARTAEGQRLESVITGQIDDVEELTEKVERAPARSVEAIRTRLAEQVARLVATETGLDPARLHQEAVVMAARADVEEEVKRLKSHVAAARALMATGGAIGRKLDFLAQEFQREANTVCSKSHDTTITEAGLAMKLKIDQLREQVQNIE